MYGHPFYVVRKANKVFTAHVSQMPLAAKFRLSHLIVTIILSRPLSDQELEPERFNPQETGGRARIGTQV